MTEDIPYFRHFHKKISSGIMLFPANGFDWGKDRNFYYINENLSDNPEWLFGRLKSVWNTSSPQVRRRMLVRCLFTENEWYHVREDAKALDLVPYIVRIRTDHNGIDMAVADSMFVMGDFSALRD